MKLIKAHWLCFWHLIYHSVKLHEFHGEYNVTTDVMLFGKIKIWNKFHEIGCTCGKVFYDIL